MARTRIVIVGGGFAGVQCAKSLRKHLSGNRGEVILFNHENHMVFHPLLAEVAGASINPEAVAAPLRQMLPGVHCRTEDVQRIDLDRAEVVYESHDGQLRHMPYDHVVLACGAAVDLGTVPGMADHAFGDRKYKAPFHAYTPVGAAPCYRELSPSRARAPAAGQRWTPPAVRRLPRLVVPTGRRGAW